MAKLQHSIFTNTADAIELGADTLEVLVAQRGLFRLIVARVKP